MKKNVRRLLFLGFLGIFLVTAPIVVMYTAGYRLDFRHLDVVKTGILSIFSEPKGAEIFINDKGYNQETNVIIKNLLPGDYLVRLEKANYLPWEKKLEVRENQTTFIHPTELFLIDEPKTIIEEPSSLTTLEPRGRQIAIAIETDGWTEIWSRRLSSSEEKILLRLPRNSFEELELLWSPLDDGILLVKEKKADQTIWHSFDSSEQNQTASINPLTVWQRDKNQFLFFETKDSQTSLLLRENLEQTKTLAVLPVGQYEFLWAPPTFVLLRETIKNKIFLIDDRGVNQPILLNTAAAVTDWNPQNQKQLLYANEFELRIFNTEDLSDELITRLSVSIGKVAWSTTGQIVFFSDNQNLSAIELDNRGGQRQIWHLATLEKIENFVVSEAGEKIYLIGTKNGARAVFERRLRE